jgi:hypothetical protein
MNQPIPTEHTHPHLFAAFVLFSCFLVTLWPYALRWVLDEAAPKPIQVQMSDPFENPKYLLNKQP